MLEKAELVWVRAEGRRRFYRARPEGLSELRQWLDAYWRSSLANLKLEVERDLRAAAAPNPEPVAPIPTNDELPETEHP